MILKIKAWIYRRTGIYLAYREELEFITSKRSWKVIIALSKTGDMTLRDAQGLMIGMWQSQHGFYRSFHRWSSTKTPIGK